MAKKKASTTTTTGANGQKYRKETKQERQVRLQQQEEARQACFKLLPIAVGIIIALLLAFAMYVRSVPVHVPAPPVTPAEDLLQTPVDAAPPTPQEPEPEAKESESTEETIEL